MSRGAGIQKPFDIMSESVSRRLAIRQSRGELPANATELELLEFEKKKDIISSND
mgnify:FL=1